ncbi:MAG: GntR family transcriptional regulator [Chitinivibrionales bacterium]|nr:GntR family transcriptional regulator [Chitinivibrionales bacterium]
MNAAAKQRKKPAVRKALEVLRSLTSVYRDRGRYVLPTIAELAAQAGVSRASVGKAVRILCDEGVLITRRGGGIRLHQPVPEAGSRRGYGPDADPLPLSRWEQVREQIIADYLVRAVDSDSLLPNCKELSGRYVASHRTVRRALQSLVDDGRLYPQGERYGRTLRTRGSFQKGIVLVIPANLAGAPANRYPNEEQNRMWLERECGQRGIAIRAYMLTSSQREVKPFSAHLPQSPSVLGNSILGAIVWLPGSAGAGLPTVLKALHFPGRPIAVGAPRPSLDTVMSRYSSGVLRGFCTPESGFEAGIAVAQHLLSHGHRTALFVMPNADGDRTDPARLAGARACFEESCGDNTLRVLRYDMPAHSLIPSSNPAWGRDDFSALSAKLEHTEALTERERRIVDALPASAIHIRGRVGDALLRQSIHRAFGQLPRPLDATAIIAWNDRAAQICMQLLGERGICVPEDLSLISFDDSTEASLGGITSYNFNDSKVLFGMLDWVVWPDRRKAGGIAAPPQGFVTERGSVKRADGAGRRGRASVFPSATTR